MKKTTKIIFPLLILLLSGSLPAQNSCYIKKVYPASRESSLRISNRYGNVNFVSSGNDSVSICVTVTIDQEDRQLAAKNMDLVSVRIDKKMDTVSVMTTYDRRFFSSSNRAGRKGFSVDILVKAPPYINLSVENAFGNIILDEISGYFSARLSYGTLSASGLKRGNSIPLNAIAVDNGKVDIDNINWITMDLHNCAQVGIGKVQALLIRSDFSKITIKSASSVVADSRSDICSIDTLKNLISESQYSTFTIGNLSGKILSKSTMGTLVIKRLQKDFGSVDITSVNSPVSITTNKDISFRSEIEAKDSQVEFNTENQPGIVRKQENNLVTWTGIYGTGIQTGSYIRINSTAGKVTIR